MIDADYHLQLDKKIQASPELFTRSQLAGMLNITPRTIHYYTDEGLLVPAENPGGKGRARKYDRTNILQLLLILELSKLNVPLKKIANIISTAGTGAGIHGPGRQVIIVYDADGDNVSHFGITDNMGFVKVGLGGQLDPSSLPDKKKVFHTSALVIDLTCLKEKAASVA